MPAIDSYFFSDVGQKRTNNEDAAGAHEPQDARQLKQSGCLYIVADGLGGHQMGEKASTLAVETLLKVYYEAPGIPPEKRLRDIIQQVNQSLIAYARKNMGPGEKTATTVVAAVVRNDTLLLANVGDSRAYLIRDGQIHQVTRDHSFVGEMLRAGALTEAEAQQSKYKNRLTRSVGGSDANLEVDVYPPIPLRPGDLLLLCTDGLTQYATGQDLLEAASKGTAREIVERLIRFANARGGSDNVTASVIKYGSKSFLPAAKLVKALAAVGAGILTLAILSLLGWLWFTGQPPFPRATATPTASPTLTATLTATLTPTQTATQTATLTPEPTLTVSPAPSDTPIPETGMSPATVNPLVNCEYIVQPRDIASEIVARFQTSLDQIFRQDGSQDDLSLMYPGEILIIMGIPSETCLMGGGTIQLQPPIAP